MQTVQPNSNSQLKIAILTGIWLSIIYWTFEAAVDAFFLTGEFFTDQLFTPGTHEFWMRTTTIIFLMTASILGGIIWKQHRKTSDELLGEKDKAQAYFDNAGVIFVVLEMDYNIKHINKRGCEVLGFQTDELIGRNWFETCVPISKRDGIESYISKLLSGEIISEEYLENPVLTKDGSERTIAWHNVILKDEFGKIIGLLSSGEDVTERKRIERELKEYQLHLEEIVSERTEDLEQTNQMYQLEIKVREETDRKLQESEEKFRTIASSALDAIVMIDNDGNVIYWNTAAIKIFGYTEEEIHGLNVHKVLAPPELLATHKKAFPEFISTGRGPAIGKVLEFNARRKDGSEFPVELTVSAVKISDKWNAIAIIRDITERKQVEEELHRHRDHLEELIENRTAELLKVNVELKQEMAERERAEKQVEHLASFPKFNPDPIIEVDSNGEIVFINPAAQELQNNIPQESFKDFIPDDIGEIIKSSQDDKKSSIYREMRINERIFSQNLYITPNSNAIRIYMRDITDRKRREEIQTVLFNIAQATNESDSLEELMKEIHEQLGMLVDTTNFYIALYDETSGVYSFPYWSDENDTAETFTPRALPGSLTDYVRRTGKPLLADPATNQRLVESGEIKLIGAPSEIWLGAPLKTPGGIIGVVAVQNYVKPDAYTEDDMALLSFVSRNIALSIDKKRAEQARRESEAKYSIFVEKAKDGVFIVQGKKLIFTNKALADILGYNVEDLQDKNFMKFIAPDAKGVVEQHYRTRMTGKDIPAMYESRLIHKNGNILDVEISRGTVSYGGKPADIGIIRDITQRKREETEKESIREINALLLGELDLERAISGLSPHISKVIPHDLLALSFIHKDRDYVDTHMIESGDEDPSKDISLSEPHSETYNGSLLHQIVNDKRLNREASIPESGTSLDAKMREAGMRSYIATPLINAGIPLGMLFLADKHEDSFSTEHSNYLEKIQSQMVLWIQHHYLIGQLSDSEVKFRNLFDNSNDAIYILQGKRFVYINMKFQTLFEYELDEVNMPNFNFMDLVASESRGLIEERSRRVDVGEKLPPNYEFKGLSKSGRLIDLDVNVSYTVLNGEPAVQGILRDISERRRFEDIENEMQMELMQHSRLASIGMLAAGIAHNINVPLQGITNHLELLRMTQDDVPYLDQMLTQVQRISAIINNMLFKSRQEQDQKEKLVNINQLLVEELTFLDADLDFKHNINKDYEFDSNLPHLQGIYSDFSQAFINIIKNAVDAMYNAELKKLNVRTTLTPQDEILVEISDSGYGIPKKHLEHIFDPFFTTKPNADERRENEPIGTGLGLASSYQLLKRYNARFDVETEEGEGTTFRIFIPACQRDTQSDEIEACESETEELEMA
ncbi:hypothetical protein CEE37_14785 [candidate division LCP-89 bacterium B3_LCP]|uniref:histidine kinase n=1 Tax=candidate division LCP-89 bacterium B3_LCP TaxID=2012998 RepID=A0A532UPW8_UNCL8|nr:MAG: hypothetical protein CEE37_14785 [candidate division LCP-89 bacterium B3_LCP]